MEPAGELGHYFKERLNPGTRLVLLPCRGPGKPAITNTIKNAQKPKAKTERVETLNV
jgi:hypothetical protein